MAVKTMTNAAMTYWPRTGVIKLGEEEVKDIAAADELVTGDSRVSKEDGDDAEHASSLAIPCFQQIGNRELGEFACARRDEVNKQQTSPSAPGLPQRREAMPIGVLRAAQQRARPYPTTEKRENQHKRRQRTPGDKIVGFGPDISKAAQ